MATTWNLWRHEASGSSRNQKNEVVLGVSGGRECQPVDGPIHPFIHLFFPQTPPGKPESRPRPGWAGRGGLPGGVAKIIHLALSFELHMKLQSALHRR